MILFSFLDENKANEGGRGKNIEKNFLTISRTVNEVEKNNDGIFFIS